MDRLPEFGAGAVGHQSKTTVSSEANRQFDLAPWEIEDWMNHAKAA